MASSVPHSCSPASILRQGPFSILNQAKFPMLPTFLSSFEQN